MIDTILSFALFGAALASITMIVVLGLLVWILGRS